MSYNPKIIILRVRNHSTRAKMTWLSDLVSGFGVPAGAATIATAIYGASISAQRAARPAALREVGAFLREPASSIRPSAVVGRIFRATFGERHLSFKCLIRSMLATIIFTNAIVLTIWLKRKNEYTYYFNLTRELTWIDLIFIGIIPDYIALAKTRIIITISRAPMFILLILDVIISISISSVFCFTTTLLFFYFQYHLPLNIAEVKSDWGIVVSNFTDVFFMSGTYGHDIPEIYFSSTLFTSVWTGLIVTSTAVLKILSPIQSFTTWFFDVEKRPIEAIGLVAGALTIMGSLVWSTAWLMI